MTAIQRRSMPLLYDETINKISLVKIFQSNLLCLVIAGYMQSELVSKMNYRM